MCNGRPGKLLKKWGKDIRCRSENPRVGSSILPPATILPPFISVTRSNVVKLDAIELPGS
jgi:hypothetical protein